VQVALADLWSEWTSFGMVLLLSSMTAACSSWCAEVTFHDTCLWSSSEFGILPHLVYTVHCWAYWTDCKTWFPSSSVCWRYWGRRSLESMQDLQQHLSTCTDDVCTQLDARHWLQLNVNTSELLWFATAHQHHQLPRCLVRIGPDIFIPLTAVRDLGIYINSDISMQTHVQWSVAGCFAILRHLHSI